MRPKANKGADGALRRFRARGYTVRGVRLDGAHMPSVKHEHLNEADYLAQEDRAQVRHEYVDGQIHAMSGASIRHNRNSCSGPPPEATSSPVPLRYA